MSVAGDGRLEELKARISEFIITEVSPDLHLERLDDDQPLIESGIVDSLGVLKMLAFLDETFGFDLASEEIKLDNFKSVRTICELLNRQGTP